MRVPRKMPERVGHSRGGAVLVTPWTAANSTTEHASGLMSKDAGDPARCYERSVSQSALEFIDDGHGVLDSSEAALEHPERCVVNVLRSGGASVVEQYAVKS